MSVDVKVTEALKDIIVYHLSLRAAEQIYKTKFSLLALCAQSSNNILDPPSTSSSMTNSTIAQALAASLQRLEDIASS